MNITVTLNVVCYQEITIIVVIVLNVMIIAKSVMVLHNLIVHLVKVN